MRTFYTPKVNGKLRDDLTRELEPVEDAKVYAMATQQWGKEQAEIMLDGHGYVEFHYIGGMIRYSQDS